LILNDKPCHLLASLYLASLYLASLYLATTYDSGRFSYSNDLAQQNTVVLNSFGERTTLAYDASDRLPTGRLSNGSERRTHMIMQPPDHS